MLKILEDKWNKKKIFFNKYYLPESCDLSMEVFPMVYTSVTRNM